MREFYEGRHRLTGRYHVTGEGPAAVAHITRYDGLHFKADADAWEAFLAAHKRNPPVIYGGGNGKGARYLRISIAGEVEMLARVLYPEAALGYDLRYRDGDRLNLTRANLLPIKRETAAAMATGETHGE